MERLTRQGWSQANGDKGKALSCKLCPGVSSEFHVLYLWADKYYEIDTWSLRSRRYSRLYIPIKGDSYIFILKNGELKNTGVEISQRKPL